MRNLNEMINTLVRVSQLLEELSVEREHDWHVDFIMELDRRAHETGKIARALLELREAFGGF